MIHQQLGAVSWGDISGTCTVEKKTHDHDVGMKTSLCPCSRNSGVLTELQQIQLEHTIYQSSMHSSVFTKKASVLPFLSYSEYFFCKCVPMTELNQSHVIAPVFHPFGCFFIFNPTEKTEKDRPCGLFVSQHGALTQSRTHPFPARRDPGKLEWAAAVNQSNFPSSVSSEMGSRCSKCSTWRVTTIWRHAADNTPS